MPQNQTVFVSGEKDQEILEFNLQGQLTGRNELSHKICD